MGKIIIENRTLGLSDYHCLSYVEKVIAQGRISNNDKQYCYLTAFKKVGGNIMVVTDLNKKSDRFVIYDDKHKINKL
jgi:hypothetical protein